MPDPTHLQLHVIPYPAVVDFVGPECYQLPQVVAIQCSETHATQQSAKYLKEALEQRFGLQCTVHTSSRDPSTQAAAVRLVVAEHLPELDQFRWKEEGYELTCGPQGIQITALAGVGLFYGIQTLLQALQPSAQGPLLAHIKILDAPRFMWRGVLLDVGRHFFPVPFIFKVLDLLALYKMNRFHWHLTEDQGWRLDVPSLPRLAEVAAWRGKRPNQSGSEGKQQQQHCAEQQQRGQQNQQRQQQQQEEQQQEADSSSDGWQCVEEAQLQQQLQSSRQQRTQPAAATGHCAAGSVAGNRASSVVGVQAPSAAVPHGGYYTPEQVAAVVQYAAERQIQVVPEVELPGHCVAALAAYPNLSCTGEVTEVSAHWGIHEDVYCAGNDEVFQFLEAVFDQVIDQFPYQYIHIGGDEVPKLRWQNCDKCRERIQQEGLANESELQSWFVRRINKYLASRGRKLIGWDEILEGGLAEGATVMSWRGNVGGIIAAKSGHDVIMTPTSHCYFDYRQAASACEPGAWYACLPLHVIYHYDPIPGLWPDPAAMVTAAAAAECDQDCSEDSDIEDHPSSPLKPAAEDGSQAEVVAPALSRDNADMEGSSGDHSMCLSEHSEEGLGLKHTADGTAERSSCNTVADCTATCADKDGAGEADATMEDLSNTLAAAATPADAPAGSNAGGLAGSNKGPEQRQQSPGIAPAPAMAVAAAAAVAANVAAANSGLAATVSPDAADAAGPHYPGNPPGNSLLELATDVATSTEQGSTPVAGAAAAFGSKAGSSASSRSSRVQVLTEDEAAHILGSQANLWCEYVQDQDTAEYMLLPRLAALAEAVWTPVHCKDWCRFRARLADHHLPLLDKLGYTYRPLD